ncbi:PAAR-like domain-containing protein [Pseudomonas sp. ABY48]|uniref:PAAR-like domain-containing protein n=1 Tax=Pseudomonas sp. ABY48 TaxID=3402865 RepID=UPI003B4321AA
MANEVFANNMEISCKAADGKSIACFPDVCFTPPQAPPTPLGVPIPYPNTGMAKDTTKGSRTVKISGKEVMLKDKSHFKTSYGDEAGNAPKKGIITSKIKGKVYFTSWSMDVKYEGKNVVRHMDLTTHNHASQPGNTMPWTYADRMALAEDLAQCEGERKRAKDTCGDASQKMVCPDISKLQTATKARKAAKDAAGDGFKDDPAYQAKHAEVQSEYSSLAKTINDDPCQKAMRCFLAPFKPNRCCPGQTGDHLIDSASFTDGPAYARQPRNQHPTKTGWSKYKTDKAPVMCAEGPNQTTATHGQMHTRRGVVALREADAKGEWPRSKATQTGAKAAKKTFPDSECSQECLVAQLNKYHDKAKDPGEEKPINASASMTRDQHERDKAVAEMCPSRSSR